MKIIEVQDKDYSDFLKAFTEKINEIENDHVVVNVSIFYNRINEKHTAIICCYE